MVVYGSIIALSLDKYTIEEVKIMNFNIFLKNTKKIFVNYREEKKSIV